VKPYTRETAEADLTEALARGHLDAAYAAAVELDRMGSKPAPSIVGSALWYAAHGLPVFPLRPGSKVPPPGLRWRDAATTDPARVRDLFAAHPGANLGLATGYRVEVIDFDGPGAHAAWGAEYGESWDAAGVVVLATVSTPRPGGLHVYVPATGGGNKAGVLPGVDIRGLGGYVVAPPSATDTGSYRFLRPLHPQELP
jgi:hypothetical protein